ncbi:MAG: sugar phosphate isomerase/epimerase family protein [Planctomycetota bacterium]
MKLGITQLCVPGTIEEVARKAAAWGYTVLEIGMKAEGGILDLATTAAGKRHIRETVRGAGLDLVSIVAGPVPDFSLFDNAPAVRARGQERCRICIDTAAELGADTMLLVPGRLKSENCYDKAMQHLADSLRAVAPHAEKAGVAIGIEQVWNRFLVSPMDMKWIIEAVAGPAVGVYIDTGNMLFWNYPEHWIRILAPHIKKVHIKDFKRQGREFDFVQPGEGEVNWPAVTRELAAAGYAGPLISEAGGTEEQMAAAVAVIRRLMS